MASALAPAHGGEDHEAMAAEARGPAHRDAIGVAGDAGKTSRTVQVDMSDAMRFSPSKLAVRHGETFRFVIRNSGALKHEFKLGTGRDLKAHDELMKKLPESA